MQMDLHVKVVIVFLEGAVQSRCNNYMIGRMRARVVENAEPMERDGQQQPAPRGAPGLTRLGQQMWTATHTRMQYWGEASKDIPKAVRLWRKATAGQEKK